MSDSNLNTVERVKSRAMRTTRANVPKAFQLLIFTCQRANKRANVPTWQRRANFSTWRANVPRRANILTWRDNMPKSMPFFQLRLPNDVPIFQLFFKRIMFFYIPNKFIPNIFYIFCIF